MIGYIGCEGLIAFKSFRFRIPSCNAYRLITMPRIFNNPAPAVTVQLLPLNYWDIKNATLKDGASDNLEPYIAVDFHNSPWHQHIYLKAKFHGSGWADREMGSIDLFFDAFRLFTGASITEGKGYQFAPIKGPFKPSHLPGMCSIADNPKLSHSKIFELTDTIADEFRKFLPYYSSIRENVLVDPDLAISHRYLERAMGFPKPPPLEDQILFLTISLEALFSPSDQHELSHRVAEHVAFFMGDSAKEVDKIYKLVKKAYGIRSKVAHGAFRDFRGAHLPDNFSVELNRLVRESILSIANLRMKNIYKDKSELTQALGIKARGLKAKRIPITKYRTICYKPLKAERMTKWFNARQN